MSEDVSLEIIKKTQNILAKYIKRPPLTEKLLKKPPFRFLHDIVTNVINETGFLQGLYNDNDMHSENIQDRETKLIFLQKLIDALRSITNEKITARPSKIIAGLEPVKTNELLQTFGLAIERRLDGKQAVQQLNNTLKISDKATASKSKTDDKTKAKKSEELKKITKKKSAEKSNTLKRKSPREIKDIKKNITGVNRSKDDKREPVDKQENDVREKINETTVTVDEPEAEVTVVPHSKAEDNEGSNVISPNSANDMSDVKTKQVVKSVEEKEAEKQRECDNRNAEQAASRLRPPSVRPSSARPAAPRLQLRPSADTLLPPEQLVALGRVQVIVEHAPAADEQGDEEETVQVVEEGTREAAIPAAAPAPPTEQRGHLVAQILQQIGGESEHKRPAAVSSAPADSRLTHSVQRLTRSANPLGKLVGYLHEDVDSMMGELRGWLLANRELRARVQAERQRAHLHLRPLHDQLKRLDQDIVRHTAMIHGAHAAVLRNHHKINALLTTHPPTSLNNTMHLT